MPIVWLTVFAVILAAVLTDLRWPYWAKFAAAAALSLTLVMYGHSVS